MVGLKPVSQLPVLNLFPSRDWQYIVGKCRRLSTTKNCASILRYPQSEGSLGDLNHLPSESKVVICGGGIIGTSVAYHLSERGMTDITILDQGSIGSGSTWASAGIVNTLRKSLSMASMARHSAKLYKDLEQSGFATGWNGCGSLHLARTQDRLVYMRRCLLSYQVNDGEAEFYSPEEIENKWPQIHTQDLKGGVFLRSDGVVDANILTRSLALLVKEKGAHVAEYCKVTNVTTEQRKVTGVETSHGYIKCDYFVNCAGQWGNVVGKQCAKTVRVPLHPCEHHYIITKPIAGITRQFPIVTDFDGNVYMREWDGGILGGGFEPRGIAAFGAKIPESFEVQLLPENWDHFQILLGELLVRMPLLKRTEMKQLLNCPEGFTPDGNFIMGLAPEVGNYYVAAGMNGAGVSCAGGVGKHMAEWILDGAPKKNLWSCDVRRFVDMHNNYKFLVDRVTETIGSLILMPPEWDYESSRQLRVSPLYTRMHEQGAIFKQHMGYERPTWFKRRSLATDDLDDTFPIEESCFGKPHWFDRVKTEYWSCRQGVCLIDMSTFTKFELRSAGSEVVSFLQYMCSNDIDRPIGTVIHSGMQNEAGGYENDCSFARVAHNRYFMISPTSQQTRSAAWLRTHLPSDGSVQFLDMTSMFTVINVIGPKAEELLAELSDESLNRTDFPSMTCKEINVGQASCILAMRLTHSGEDGWILYIPSEYALHVYDSLMNVGRNYGIQNAGYYALRVLRTEKFFAYWGTDLTPYVTPMECGREYRVKFNDVIENKIGKFIGYDALLAQKKNGIKKKLVQLLLQDFSLETDSWPWGGEPIYRNNVFVGLTTSTGFGFTLKHQVCLGYVHDFDPQSGESQIINMDYILKNAHYEVDVAGKRFSAKVNVYPPKLAPATRT